MSSVVKSCTTCKHFIEGISVAASYCSRFPGSTVSDLRQTGAKGWCGPDGVYHRLWALPTTCGDGVEGREGMGYKDKTDFTTK